MATTKFASKDFDSKIMFLSDRIRNTYLGEASELEWDEGETIMSNFINYFLKNQWMLYLKNKESMGKFYDSVYEGTDGIVFGEYHVAIKTFLFFCSIGKTFFFSRFIFVIR